VRSTSDVLAHFNVSESSGLSDNVVEASRQKYGKNGMSQPPSRKFIAIAHRSQPFPRTPLLPCGS